MAGRAAPAPPAAAGGAPRAQGGGSAPAPCRALLSTAPCQLSRSRRRGCGHPMAGHDGDGSSDWPTTANPMPLRRCRCACEYWH
eukprot:8833845-Lingulodinium_polyedra.AAC.1